jgi:putative ABC transport system substrate-binding protein
MRRVGFLHALAENDPEAQARVAVLREGLARLGWTDRNVRIEQRFAEADFAQTQAYAGELVGSAPDVIVASSTPALAALKQATTTIPIVFSIVSDPAGQGFVATLARPGGNITEFSFVDFLMLGKWLEVLKEIAPSVKRITLVFNPQTAPYYPVSCAISERLRQRSPPSFRQHRCMMRRRSRLPCRHLRANRTVA